MYIVFKGSENFFGDLKWFISYWIIWRDAISIRKNYLKVDDEIDDNFLIYFIFFRLLHVYVFHFKKSSELKKVLKYKKFLF